VLACGEKVELLGWKFTTDVLVRHWFGFVRDVIEVLADPTR
jgi:hypothetical protein